VADEVEILVNWLHNDVFSLVGPDQATRLELFDFIVDSLYQLTSFKKWKIEPVWRSLVNQRDELLRFASRLDQKVEELASSFQCGTELVRGMLSLQLQAPLTNVYWQKATTQASLPWSSLFSSSESCWEGC
jgi:hypothetical protein